jgi:fructokinase
VLERTSTATAQVAVDGSSRYEFDVEWRMARPIDRGAATIVHVGSIGCYLEPGASQVRQVVREVAGAAQITFDPNIRPSLLPDRAEAVAITEEIARSADVIKLSDEDAAWLYPRASIDDVITSLLARGAGIVAVTSGSGGATLASRLARVRVAAHPVAVKDTIGAGDTFMAAMVASIAYGRHGCGAHDLETSGRVAAVAASLTVGRAGADLPTRAEVVRAVAAAALAPSRGSRPDKS